MDFETQPLCAIDENGLFVDDEGLDDAFGRWIAECLVDSEVVEVLGADVEREALSYTVESRGRYPIFTLGGEIGLSKTLDGLRDLRRASGDSIWFGRWLLCSVSGHRGAL